ncbi:MAG: hypothetical protein ACJAZO_003780 [Myxococcota bacterium]|jgi:hypothetical protein
MWILALLAACSSAPDEPLPYVYDDVDETTPALALTELEAAIEGFFSVIFTITAQPLADAYWELAADQDAYCPPQYTEDGNTYWFGECTTEGGTTYSGYAFAQEYADVAEGEYVYEGAAIFGVFDLVGANGETLTGGGEASWVNAVYTGDDTAHTTHQNNVSGTFYWDAPRAADSWLSGEVNPDILMVANYIPEFNGGRIQMSGGVSGLGAPADTVVVDELVMVHPDITACGIEPAGVMGVRAADGNWFDVVFDGTTEFGGEIDPETCDGCGGVYWRGSYLGDVCPDFSALSEWENTPW